MLDRFLAASPRLISRQAVQADGFLESPSPDGYAASGSFCAPRADAQDAIALAPNGTCSHGWTRSGSFCLPSGSGR
jgi:hypothetical protein